MSPRPDQRWKLEGGPYDGIIVGATHNEDPIIGVAIFPDRLEVQGEFGFITYRLERDADGVRAIVEDE